MHLGLGAVARDSGGTRIHHIFDVWDGQAGLGDVGGKDDPSAKADHLALLEHSMLFGRAQATIKRHNLGAFVEHTAGDLALDRILGIANLGFTREKDQGVSLGLELEFNQSADNTVDIVVGCGLFIWVGIV